MSDDAARKWAQEKKKRESEAQDRSTGYATCLHCGNPFRTSDGVVTSDAAICDVCNGN
jgi:formylmethanofuran dehydrogenase subunit E